MPPKHKTKPQRSTYTAKLSDPHDVYRGNSNHWSVMRVEGDDFVLKTQQQEREAKGQVPKPPAPHPGCTQPPFIWSPDNALQLRCTLPFNEVVLQQLGGEAPGTLSTGLHKNYNKSIFNWTPNHFRAHAKANFRYWHVKDMTFCLAKRPKVARNELPI